MSFVQLVAVEGEPCDGPVRLCSLPARGPSSILSTTTHMPETPASNPGSDRSPRELSDSIERQIVTMERLSWQHYPDGGNERIAYENGLLRTRLREFAAMFTRLEVR